MLDRDEKKVLIKRTKERIGQLAELHFDENSLLNKYQKKSIQQMIETNKAVYYYLTEKDYDKTTT